jgi:putative membrane protein
MRRFKLCSVGFVLACGGQSVPFIKETTGDALIDNTLYRVEALRKSWM